MPRARRVVSALELASVEREGGLKGDVGHREVSRKGKWEFVGSLSERREGSKVRNRDSRGRMELRLGRKTNPRERKDGGGRGHSLDVSKHGTMSLNRGSFDQVDG